MSDPAGKWNILLKTPFGDKAAILELSTHGEGELTGSISHGEHRAAISRGKVRGAQLSWSVDLQQPMKISLSFTASADEDRISGKAKHLLGSATFTGTRA